MICNFRAVITIYILFNWGIDLQGQIDTSVRKIDTVMINSSAITFKSKQLYDQMINDTRPNIGGFEALDIFNGQVDKQLWVSPETHCVQLNKKTLNFEGYSRSINFI